MGLPSALTSEAYDIVDKAMATGARGQTSLTTDYSSISDAFMKKASLDAQIGGMMMDNTMQRAQLMSDLDMGKANLYMQSANLQMQESQFVRQLDYQKSTDKMSPFEQITGVLAGAAAPAAAGFAVGGPTGAVVGGLVGGALTLGAGNSRRAQSNIIGNIGTISNAALTIKQTANAKAGQNAAAELAKGVAAVAGVLRTAAPGSPEYQQAQQQLDSYVNSYTQSAVKAGIPLQQAYQSAATIRKEALQGFDPNDRQMVATRSMQTLTAEAKADPTFMDPGAKGHRQRVQQFQSDMSSAYTMGYGKEAKPSMRQAWVGSVSPDVASDYFSGGSQAVGGGVRKTTRNLSSMGGTVQMDSDPGVSDAARPSISPVAGRSIQQAPQAPQDGTMVPNLVMAPQGGQSPVSQAWGIEMDNAGAMLSDISKRSAEMAKDPSLAAQALGRGDLVDSEKDAEGFDVRKETPQQYHDRLVAIKEGRYQPQARSQAASKMEPVVKSETGTSEPELTSNNPQTQKHEHTFKTAVDPDTMLNEFGLKGRYANEAQREKIVGLANSGLEVNKFEKFVLDDKIRGKIESMTPQQRRNFQIWLDGQGEGAMHAKSGGLNANIMGFGAGGSFTDFKRNLETRNEQRGEKFDLTDDQIKTLQQIQTKANPLARQIALGYNKGTLTNEDVQGFYAGLYNVFETNAEVASAGLAPLKDMIWNKFYMDYSTMDTASSASSRKMDENMQRELMRRETQRQKASLSDEAGIFD